MLPMIARLKFKEPGRRGFGLWFPVILVWILLAALLIAIFPFMLLAALVTAERGPGRMLLFLYPWLAAILWNLSGLTIDVRAKERVILIDFI